MFNGNFFDHIVHTCIELKIGKPEPDGLRIMVNKKRGIKRVQNEYAGNTYQTIENHTFFDSQIFEEHGQEQKGYQFHHDGKSINGCGPEHLVFGDEVERPHKKEQHDALKMQVPCQFYDHQGIQKVAKGHVVGQVEVLQQFSTKVEDAQVCEDNAQPHHDDGDRQS